MILRYRTDMARALHRTRQYLRECEQLKKLSMKYELTPFKVFSNIPALKSIAPDMNDKIRACKTEKQLDRLIRKNIIEVYDDEGLNNAIFEQRGIIYDNEVFEAV